MHLIVAMADGVVTIDGLPLACDFKRDASIASIRWHGEALYGHITPTDPIGGGDFNDPAVIAPYVVAWRTALQQRLDAVAAATTAELAAFQKKQREDTALAKQLAGAATGDAARQAQRGEATRRSAPPAKDGQ